VSSNLSFFFCKAKRPPLLSPIIWRIASPLPPVFIEFDVLILLFLDCHQKHFSEFSPSASFLRRVPSSRDYAILLVQQGTAQLAFFFFPLPLGIARLLPRPYSSLKAMNARQVTDTLPSLLDKIDIVSSVAKTPRIVFPLFVRELLLSWFVHSLYVHPRTSFPPSFLDWAKLMPFSSDSRREPRPLFLPMT